MEPWLETRPLTSDLKNTTFLLKLMRFLSSALTGVEPFFLLPPALYTSQCACKGKKNPLICSLLLAASPPRSRKAAGCEKRWLGTIKTRPRLICRLLRCKYTRRVGAPLPSLLECFDPPSSPLWRGGIY